MQCLLSYHVYKRAFYTLSLTATEKVPRNEPYKLVDHAPPPPPNLNLSRFGGAGAGVSAAAIDPDAAGWVGYGDSAAVGGCAGGMRDAASGACCCGAGADAGGGVGTRETCSSDKRKSF